MDESTVAKEDGQSNHIVRIWDAPETRINFLETILKDKEWEAVVYHPDFAPDGKQKANPSTPLPELAEKLQTRGYKTALGQDENGIPTLTVRKFGSDTSLATALGEMGFVKGMTHKISNIGEPLGNAISKVGALCKYMFTDKARLIGTTYLLGDLFLAGAGSDGKKDKLKTLAGVGATLQSLIFMAFAKEGSEAMFSKLMATADKSVKEGRDLLDADTWRQMEVKSHNPLSMGHRFLQRYPIQLGALAQIAGQVALFSSGVKGLRQGGDKKGALSDMMTGVSSSIGWSLVMRHGKEVPDEEKAAPGTPKRLWQEMSANPNKFASGFLAASTATGIIGGIFDRDGDVPTLDKDATVKEKVKHLYQNSNKAQVLAYSTYLVGDGVMFATQSEHYGAKGMADADMLATAAEEFIKASPLVLGVKEQEQLVGNLSEYLANRAAEEVARKEKREMSDEDISLLTKRIGKNLMAKLPAVNPRTNEVAGHIAGIVGAFHPQLGNPIVEALCETFSKVHGVAIDDDELKTHVMRQVEYAPEPDKKVTVKDIEKPLAALVQSLPGAASADVVDRMFTALGDYLQPEQAASRARPEQEVVGQHTAALASRPQPAGVGARLE